MLWFCQISRRKQVEIYSLQGKSQGSFRLVHVLFLHLKVEKV